MDKEKIFLMKQSDMSRVVQYLAKLPYEQVNELIPLFFNLKEGVEKNGVSVDKEKDKK